jgi:hypothetical protein
MSDNNLQKAVELFTELHPQANTTNVEEEEYETGSDCYDISLSSSPNYDYLGLDYDDYDEDISTTTTELINNLTTTKEEEGDVDTEKRIDTPLPTITTTTNNKGQIDNKSTKQLDDEEYYDNDDDDVLGEEYILGTMMVRVLQARNVQVIILYTSCFIVCFRFHVGETLRSSLHAYMVFVLKTQMFFFLFLHTHTTIIYYYFSYSQIRMVGLVASY